MTDHDEKEKAQSWRQIAHLERQRARVAEDRVRRLGRALGRVWFMSDRPKGRWQCFFCSATRDFSETPNNPWKIQHREGCEIEEMSGYLKPPVPKAD